MLWLATGNMESLFRATGFSFALEASANNMKQMELDLRRAFFIGTNQEAKSHIAAWQNATALAYYQQNNMSAADLGMIFRAQKPFMDNEEFEKLPVFQKPCHFAFVDDQEVLCGLIVFFRPDNPSKWLIGLVKNTNLTPKERAFTLLSNFDPMEFTPDGLLITREGSPDDFTKQISNPFVKKICEEVLVFVNDDASKLKVFRTVHLLRALAKDSSADVIVDKLPLEKIALEDFFSQNRALDLITEHGLALTTKQLLDCVNEPHGLRKALEEAKLTSDFKQNKVILGLVVLFYEANILDLCTLIFSDKVVLETVDNLMRDPVCCTLLIDIIKAQYSFGLFKTIISNEAYYKAISPLLTYLALKEDRKLRFKDELGALFSQENKLAELLYIHSLQDEKLKTLCLYFWFKNGFRLEEYQDLVETVTNSPYLIDVLLALGKAKTHAIGELKEIAFSPLKSQKEVILYQLADDFDKQYIRLKAEIETILSLSQEDAFAAKKLQLQELISVYTVLNGLTFNEPKNEDELTEQTDVILKQFAANFKSRQIKINEALTVILSLENDNAAKKLIELVNSYNILKDLTVCSPNTYYLLVAQNDFKGKLLCLFLPTFAKYKVNDNAKDKNIKRTKCQSLIDLLYVGVMDGAISQRNRIQELTDPVLKQQAQELHECFLCAQQMESLGFDKKVLEFAIGNDVGAVKLRQIIFKVEDVSDKILARVSASSEASRSEKIASWKAALDTYKEALYRIAYRGLKKEGALDFEGVCEAIATEEALILEKVDPDDKSWLEKALIVMANIVISAFTFGVANYIKGMRTKNYFFFTESPSGEEVRALNSDIKAFIRKP